MTQNPHMYMTETQVLQSILKRSDPMDCITVISNPQILKQQWFCASWGGWGRCSTIMSNFQDPGRWSSLYLKGHSLVDRGKESMTNLTVAFKTGTWSGTSHFCSHFFGQVSWTRLTSRGWKMQVYHVPGGKNQKYLVKSMNDFHKYILWWLILCFNFMWLGQGAQIFS